MRNFLAAFMDRSSPIFKPSHCHQMKRAVLQALVRAVTPTLIAYIFDNASARTGNLVLIGHSFGWIERNRMDGTRD